MARVPLSALLTDFGTRDWYAASLKAVILSRAPRAQLVDITHDIPPFNIPAAAITLASSILSVGTARRLIAAHTERSIFLGPDNGVLSLALDRAARRRIVRLTFVKPWLPVISRTFHGRDILQAGGCLPGHRRSAGEARACADALSVSRLALGCAGRPMACRAAWCTSMRSAISSPTFRGGGSAQALAAKFDTNAARFLWYSHMELALRACCLE